MGAWQIPVGGAVSPGLDHLTSALVITLKGSPPDSISGSHGVVPRPWHYPGTP